MKSRAGDRFKFRPELGKLLRELRLKAGLMQAVLQGIRTDVFNVAAPIGPEGWVNRQGRQVRQDFRTTVDD